MSVQCIDLIEEFGNKCLKFVTKLVRTLELVGSTHLSSGGAAVKSWPIYIFGLFQLLLETASTLNWAPTTSFQILSNLLLITRSYDTF